MTNIRNYEMANLIWGFDITVLFCFRFDISPLSEKLKMKAFRILIFE